MNMNYRMALQEWAETEKTKAEGSTSRGMNEKLDYADSYKYYLNRLL